jgi:hypothetical protein
MSNMDHHSEQGSFDTLMKPVTASSETRALEALVPEALANGWFYIDQQLVPPENDIRRTWAAMWKPIRNGKLAPHWLIDAPIKGWFMPNPKTISTIGIKDDEVIAAGGTQFETGAVRSADKNHVMYQLISPIGMRRMAETMKEGFDKYGAYNWERGMPIGDLLNHAIAHIYAFLSGIPSVDAKTGKAEDDLAHAAWNLFAAMHMEETHPELDHGLRKNVEQSKP